MNCKLCGDTFIGPRAIQAHRLEAHGIKPKLGKKKKPSKPVEELTGPQRTEEELLTNVVGWFEEAQQTPEARTRVIRYLEARYIPVPELKPFLYDGRTQQFNVPVNGSATATETDKGAQLTEYGVE